MAATVPSKIKALGKSSNIRGFREDEWDREDVGRRYMYEANRAKVRYMARAGAVLGRVLVRRLLQARYPSFSISKTPT